MKKLNILLVAVCLTCSANLFAGSPATTKLSPAYLQEDRNVGSFSGIAAGGSLNYNVTMGSSESLRFEGDADAIAELVAEVNGSVLEIRPKTKWNDWNRKYNRAKITVHITARKLSSLTLSGSGSMLVNGTINGKDLVTTLSGSGNIKAGINVSNYRSVISGSGRVVQTGKATDAVVTLSGSGSFGGKDFAAENVKLQISGSANAAITANKTIDIVISGSGHVTYYGNAKVNKTMIGSGSIRKG